MSYKLIVFSLFLFVFLVIYNRSVTQKTLLQTYRSSQEIVFTSFPVTATAGKSEKYSWEINSTTDKKTDFTAIYYSSISTPSALTKNDSPDAVGYQRYTTDYSSGSFFLPSKFETNLVIEKPQTIWFRGYAKVGEDHLWTEEKSVIVTP